MWTVEHFLKNDVFIHKTTRKKSKMSNFFIVFGLGRAWSNFFIVFGLGRAWGKVGLCSPFYLYFFLAMIRISGGEKLDVSVHTPSVDPPYRSTLHTIKGQSEHRSKMCNLGQLGPRSTHLMAF